MKYFTITLALVLICILQLNAFERYRVQHKLVTTLITNKLYHCPGQVAIYCWAAPSNFVSFFEGTTTINSNTLLRLPQRNVNAIAATIAGVDSRAGETPNIFGARADGTAYYVDGVRLRCTDLQVESIGQSIPGNQKYPF